MSEYEVFRSKYQVTEWRDGAVYRTRFVETDWFDMDEVDHPNTVETNVSYAPPTDPAAPLQLTDEERRGIRRKVTT